MNAPPQPARPAERQARDRPRDIAAEDRLERAKASEQRDSLIRQAKSILMEVRGISEPEAHRYLQKRSMDMRRTLQGVALDLITAASALRQPSISPVRRPRDPQSQAAQEVAA